MGKYTKLTDGCVLLDISESEGGYNYYGHKRNDGYWVILREKTDRTEYRYAYGTTDTYATAWANRTSKSYVIPTI